MFTYIFCRADLCSSVKVEYVRLFHHDPDDRADFIDVSEDSNSPQVIEFGFELESTENFEKATFYHEDDEVASFDSAGNYQSKIWAIIRCFELIIELLLFTVVLSPFDEVGAARIGVNSESGFGRFSMTKPTLSDKGSWKVIVETDQGSEDSLESFFDGYS